MKVLWALTTLSTFLSMGECSINLSQESNYLINTDQCKIPDFPPFSQELYFARNATLQCSNFDPLLSFTTFEDGQARLHISHRAVTKYFKSLDNIMCCYSYVFRNGTEMLPDKGVVVSHCKEFDSVVDLNHDLVWVSCSRSENYRRSFDGFPIFPVYENVHQVITVPEPIRKKAEILQKSSARRPISVLMVIIDSISRLNFIRTMPLTKNFLRSKNFYEYRGYNKIGDNTFPNAMAFLAGLTLKEASQICKPTEVDGLMNCPFIWYKFRDLGYATAYGEDWSQLATFNYLKKGFKDKPTDYYFKPYMDAITYLRVEWQDNMPFCAGPESQGGRILNLAYDFAHKLKYLPSFGVFWMNTFSHEEITSPASMDRNVMNFFTKLEDSEILDESIVIFLSDHGIRFGEINNTTRGFYEVRLPMHYVSLPPWFKRQYPVETRHFEENADKLTRTNHSITPISACPHCRSFFEKIPENRNCSEAGIPKKWCTCNVNFTNVSDDFD